MMQVPWSGVSTNHSTSPFAEEMYEKIRENLIQYEVVINRWPQYSLILEHVSSHLIPSVLCQRVILLDFGMHSSMVCVNLISVHIGFFKAAANVERAIIKALEKQYGDILTPLKDTIQKRLNIQVQKLTRRQSVTIYSVPNQVSENIPKWPKHGIRIHLATDARTKSPEKMWWIKSNWSPHTHVSQLHIFNILPIYLFTSLENF